MRALRCDLWAMTSQLSFDGWCMISSGSIFSRFAAENFSDSMSWYLCTYALSFNVSSMRSSLSHFAFLPLLTLPSVSLPPETAYCAHSGLWSSSSATSVFAILVVLLVVGRFVVHCLVYNPLYRLLLRLCIALDVLWEWNSFPAVFLESFNVAHGCNGPLVPPLPGCYSALKYPTSMLVFDDCQ